jgi:transposase
MNQGIEPTFIDHSKLFLAVQDLANANALLTDEKALLEQENSLLKAKYADLLEHVRLLKHQRFGASSEKYAADQQDLFNEAEAEATDSEEAPEADTALDDQVTAVIGSTDSSPSTTAKRGRKALPSELPRIEVTHDLPLDQQHCPEGHALKVIGEEVSEQLDIIPAKIQVLRHIRLKYACPCCAAHVKTANLPEQPIPKSNASAGLLAYIAVSKFQDALPLYRQTQLFQRIGVELARGTLATWMMRSGALIQPLINLMQEHIDHYDLQQIDETTVQVLKEAGKKAETQSYMWVQRGGPPHQPVLLFTYAATRAKTVAEDLLANYQGYLQSDGYAGYDAVCINSKLMHVGCFAHARRKFDEALKAQGHSAKAGKASKGLIYIQKLYRIERQIKEQSAEQRYQVRQKLSVPILAEIKTWLNKSLLQVPPTSKTGQALTYLNNQWHKLIRYCDDGRLSIDNNACENAIRPFVIGRRNWLFSDTVKGAKASANLYSLIETAKANGLEPYRYLRHVFNELPKAKSLEAIEELLPWQVDKQEINKGWKQKIDGV